MPGDSENIAGWKLISSSDKSTHTYRTPTGWRIISLWAKCDTPLYEGMHRLICKLAWRYARRCALDAEDLINEGYLVLLKVQHKYDPNRASRSTFVYWVVRNHFCELAQRWQMHFELPSDLSAGDPSLMLERGHAFRNAVQTLSEEAKDIVRIILNSPIEICQIAKDGTPQRLQQSLKKVLQKKGWVEETILPLLQEISKVVNYNK